jgi:hypothetical protein
MIALVCKHVTMLLQRLCTLTFSCRSYLCCPQPRNTQCEAPCVLVGAFSVGQLVKVLKEPLSCVKHEFWCIFQSNTKWRAAYVGADRLALRLSRQLGTFPM